MYYRVGGIKRTETATGFLSGVGADEAFLAAGFHAGWIQITDRCQIGFG